MANGAILGQSTTTWTNDQILSSVSAALYSLGANATPDQVFAAIRPLITTAQNSANNAQSAANAAQQTANNAINDAEDAQNTANNALSVANGKVQIVTGSYVGNGEESLTITLGFKPRFMTITSRYTYNGQSGPVLYVYGDSDIILFCGYTNNQVSTEKTISNTGITFLTNYAPFNIMNESTIIYDYVAFK